MSTPTTSAELVALRKVCVKDAEINVAIAKAELVEALETLAYWEESLLAAEHDHYGSAQ